MFRQDPDVIMVGEMRDWQTMQTVLTAAETGHSSFPRAHEQRRSGHRPRGRLLPSQQHGRSDPSSLVLGRSFDELIEKSDGSGLLPVVEIMINSPKIAKHIETGDQGNRGGMETSVAYYRMQTMNQSLLALLVNNRITYERAMELSTDPEDLSLKLRKLFPQIEERRQGGPMDSDNDFSHIARLMETKQLYDQQEQQWRMRLSEKDEEIARHRADNQELRRASEAS